MTKEQAVFVIILFLANIGLQVGLHTRNPIPLLTGLFFAMFGGIGLYFVSN